MDNKAGSAFFGIDTTYIAQVQSREIFDLVSEGFTPESLERMPIAKRRLYYHRLIEKYQPNKEPPPGAMNPAQPQKKSQK